MNLAVITDYLEKALEGNEEAIRNILKARLSAFGNKSIMSYILEHNNPEEATKDVLAVLKRMYRV